MNMDFDALEDAEVLQELYSEEANWMSFRVHVDMVQAQRDEMKLLLFCSQGSNYSKFREVVAKKYEQSAARFYDIVKKHNPSFRNDVSYLFMHACALLYIGFVEELIHHDPNEDEINRYIYDIATFVRSGMIGILGSPTLEEALENMKLL